MAEKVLLPGFEVDLDGDSLRSVEGGHVQLRPKAWSVLRALAEHVNAIVSKDDLLRDVWGDTPVTEDALTQCVMEVRKVIGDSEHLILRTVPRRGYVLVGSLEATSRGAANPLIPGRSQVSYAKSGNLHIAYQTAGSGPGDIVLVQGYITHLEIEWEQPLVANFYNAIASFSRLVRFDKRGTGLSDRVSDIATLEERMDDLRAVMDAAGLKRATVFGSSEGGALAMLFAATYPERVSGLILYGVMPREAWAPDYPWGRTKEQFENAQRLMAEKWGQGHSVDWFAPSLSSDAAYRQWRGRIDRAGASPGAAVLLSKMNEEIDVRGILAAIKVPTLIMHRSGDRPVNVDHGRYVAQHIPHARYVEFLGSDHAPWVSDSESIVKEIRSFVLSDSAEGQPRTQLAALLHLEFADDGKARMDLREIRTIVDQSGGAILASEASHLLVAFDGPSRAIRCGSEVLRSIQRATMKAAVHVGECDLEHRQSDAFAVVQKMAQMAPPGRLIVSQIVKDLTPGAGLSFEIAAGNPIRGGLLVAS